MHVFQLARRRPAHWQLVLLGLLLPSLIALALVHPARGLADANPNNYQCLGHIAKGVPETGVTDQQVQYTIACNGPITGYQLLSQVSLSGFDSAPLVSDLTGKPITTDSFSCNGDFPGHAFNCVGSAAKPFETITGQFTIESQLCVAPRVDPQLTVTYASTAKNVITQAISGPFDLGRPHGCRTWDKHHNPDGSRKVSHKAKAHKKQQHAKKS